MVTKNDKDEEMTQEQIEALAKQITIEMREQMVKQFFNDIGRGVWGLAWKVMVIGLVLLAGYGAVKH